MNERKLLITNIATFGSHLKIIGQLQKQKSNEFYTEIAPFLTDLEAPSDIKCLRLGMLCFAKRNFNFCRAIIKTTVSSEDVSVDYLDFGHNGIVKINDIRIGPFSKYIEETPPFCSAYILHGFVNNWNKSDLSKIRRIILHEEMEYQIVMKVHSYNIIKIKFNGSDLADLLVNYYHLGNWLDNDLFGESFLKNVAIDVALSKNKETVISKVTDVRNKLKAIKPARPLHSTSLSDFTELKDLDISANSSSESSNLTLDVRLSENKTDGDKNTSAINSDPSKKVMDLTVASDVSEAYKTMTETKSSKIDLENETQSVKRHNLVMVKHSIDTFKSSSLKVGCTYEVLCCLVENGPYAFWVQPTSSAAALKSLNLKMQEATLKRVYKKPLIGTAVIARCQKSKQLYRALITSIKAKSCGVTCVDYGIKSEVKSDDIFEIPSVFLLQETFAIKCSLFDCKTVRLSPCNLHETFQELVLNNVLLAKIMPTVGETSIQCCELLLNNNDVLTTLKTLKMEMKLLKPDKLINDEDVIIRYVESAKILYVQKVSEIAKFDELMDEINIYCRDNPLKLTKIAKGKPCSVFHSTDWFRAEIVSIMESKITVNFVDYGFSKIVTQSDLYHITEDHLQLPRQAIHCELNLNSSYDDTKNNAAGLIEMLAHAEGDQRQIFRVEVFESYSNSSYKVNLHTDKVNLVQKIIYLSESFNQIKSELFKINANPKDPPKSTPAFTTESAPANYNKARKDNIVNRNNGIGHSVQIPLITPDCSKRLTIIPENEGIPKDIVSERVDPLSRFTDPKYRRFCRSDKDYKPDCFREEPTTLFYQSIPCDSPQQNDPLNYSGDTDVTSWSSQSIEHKSSLTSLSQQKDPQTTIDDIFTADVNLRLLIGQSMMVTITCITEIFNFEVLIEGTTMKCICSYNDSDNSDLAAKFKREYNGKTCVLSVLDLLENQVLLVKPAESNRKENVVCPIPIMHDYFNVTIVHVHSIHRLIAHTSTTVKAIEKLVKDMQNYYENNGDVLNNPKLGHLTAVKSMHGNWYRGRILSINDKSNELLVQYIDYGKNETIRDFKINLKIKKLELQFTVPSSYSIEINLPIRTMNSTNLENKTAVEKLKMLTLNKKFKVQVIEMRHNHLIGNIFSEKEESIVKTLKEQGLTIFEDLQAIREVLDKNDVAKTEPKGSGVPQVKASFSEKKTERTTVEKKTDAIGYKENIPIDESDRDCIVNGQNKLEITIENKKKRFSQLWEEIEREMMINEPTSKLQSAQSRSGNKDQPPFEPNTTTPRVVHQQSKESTSVEIPLESKLTPLVQPKTLVQEQFQTPPRATPQAPPKALSQAPPRAPKQAPPSTIPQAPPRALLQAPFRVLLQGPNKTPPPVPPRAQRQQPQLQTTLQTQQNWIQNKHTEQPQYKPTLQTQQNWIQNKPTEQPQLEPQLQPTLQTQQNWIQNKPTEQPQLEPQLQPTLQTQQNWIQNKPTEQPQLEPQLQPTLQTQQNWIQNKPTEQPQLQPEHSWIQNKPTKKPIKIIGKEIETIEIEHNHVEKGYISYYDNPGRFYIQMSKESKQLRQLQNYLQCVLMPLESIPVVNNGLMCIAFSICRKQWCRAKVIDDVNRVIQFIDFGDYGFISRKTELKEMLLFNEIKPMAILCSLIASPTGKWCYDTNEIMKAAYEKTVEFKFVAKVGNTNFISLFIDGEDVTKKLIANKLAQPLEILNSDQMCTIVYVNSMEDFYIHLHIDDDQFKYIKRYFMQVENFKKLHRTYKDMICAAKRGLNDGFCRAKLLSRTENNRFKVLFIDYGEIGFCTDVRKISDQIATLPPLARNCALYLPKDVVLTHEAENRFVELVNDGQSKFKLQLMEAKDCSVIHIFKDGQNVFDLLKPLCR